MASNKSKRFSYVWFVIQIATSDLLAVSYIQGLLFG